MIRLRLASVLVATALVVLGLVVPAWAHPGHDGAGRAAEHVIQVADQADTAASWDALRRYGPATAGLLAAALSLVASMPQRRRAHAAVLLLPLLAISLEGVAHAALHLGHARHADRLAIDASAAVPAVELDSTAPFPAPVLALGEPVEIGDLLVQQIVVAASRGRAPPLLPA
jgi:hypothetical protein